MAVITGGRAEREYHCDDCGYARVSAPGRLCDMCGSRAKRIVNPGGAISLIVVISAAFFFFLIAFVVINHFSPRSNYTVISGQSSRDGRAE